MTQDAVMVTFVATFLGVGVANVAFARRRAVRFFRGAGMQIVSLKIRWRGKRTDPLSSREGKMIFCAHLRDSTGASVPAWISSAGMIPLYVGEALEVKFTPTGAFPKYPAL
jgi:hypothetical protein